MPTFFPLALDNSQNSLKEPGCHRFDVLTDPERPNELYLYELYDDRAAFDAHQQTAHYARFRDGTEPILAGKDVAFWSMMHA